MSQRTSRFSGAVLARSAIGLRSFRAEIQPEQTLELRQRRLGPAMEHGRHPHGLGALAVLAQVVDEHAFLRWQPDALRAHPEDLGLRLVQADLARDHDAVEELRERLAVVAARAEGVRDQAGGDAGCLGALYRRHHRPVGSHAGEQPIDEALAVLHAQAAADPPGELVLGDLPDLDLAQVAAGVVVLPEQVEEGLRVEALVLAEGPEGLEDVGREDAAEVDEEAGRSIFFHVFGAGMLAASHAASARRGTPSSKRPRYSSSVLPAMKRL